MKPKKIFFIVFGAVLLYALYSVFKKTVPVSTLAGASPALGSAGGYALATAGGPVASSSNPLLNFLSFLNPSKTASPTSNQDPRVQSSVYFGTVPGLQNPSEVTQLPISTSAPLGASSVYGVMNPSEITYNTPLKGLSADIYDMTDDPGIQGYMMNDPSELYG